VKNPRKATHLDLQYPSFLEKQDPKKLLKQSNGLKEAPKTTRKGHRWIRRENWSKLKRKSLPNRMKELEI